MSEQQPADEARRPDEMTSWAVPSPGIAAPAAPVADDAATRPTVPVTTGAPPYAAAPAVPAGSPIRSAVSRFRRPVLGLAGAGAAVLLIGAGFLAGLSVGRQDRTSLISSGSVAGSSDGTQQGPAGGYGQGAPWDPDGDHSRAGGVAGVGVVFGQVTAVSGSSLTLVTGRGSTVTVTTTSSTTVGGTSGGSLSGLKVGQVVVVAGTQSSDGTIVATSITARSVRAGSESGGRGEAVPGQSTTGTTGTTGTSGSPSVI